MRTFVQLREILYIKCVLYSYYLLCREYDHCSSTDPRHEAVTVEGNLFIEWVSSEQPGKRREEKRERKEGEKGKRGEKERIQGFHMSIVA